jgi:hypothetical protein
MLRRRSPNLPHGSGRHPFAVPATKAGLLAAANVATLTACSALVDVDPARLPDLGTMDLGGMRDGGMLDAGTEDLGGLDAGDAGDPRCPSSCDDGVPCTSDRCDAATGACVHVPDDGACPAGQRCAPMLGCVARACTNDASCDDGLYCNGTERCRPGSAEADPVTGCVAGVPVRCFDDFGCTVDSCDEANDRCVFTPDATACDDRVDCTVDACEPTAAGAGADGCTHRPDDSMCPGMCASATALRAGRCGATGCVLGTAMSCADGNPCTANACAAGACTSTPRDDDRDGFPAARATIGGMTVSCAGGTDCDDTNAAVNPGAAELCNGRDDDCDGEVDEGCGPVPPDTCRSVQRLTPVGGVATVRGRFSDFADDYVTACIQSDTGRGGRDAVYAIEITSLSDVEITTEGTTVDTIVAAGTTCGTWLGCDDDIQSGRSGTPANTASRLWVHRIGPSVGSSSVTLFVLVDAYGAGVTGEYVLSVRVRPATEDSCGGGFGSSTPLDISSGGSVLGFLSLAAAIGGHSGSCQEATDRFGPEGVFTFVTSDGSQRFFAVSPSFRPDLYVRTGSCSGPSAEEAGCVRGTAGSGGGTASLTTELPPGTRGWVFVDNASGGSRYVLDYDP